MTKEFKIKIWLSVLEELQSHGYGVGICIILDSILKGLGVRYKGEYDNRKVYNAPSEEYIYFIGLVREEMDRLNVSIYLSRSDRMLFVKQELKLLGHETK